jgi:predicted nucleic acid-binding protein
MSARFFLDTIVFIYSFDASAPAKSRRASQLIREGIATRKGVVGYQVVQEFFNVALRRFTHPMSGQEALQYLATVFQPMLSVASSAQLFRSALETCERYRLAWYDSLIVASALAAECAILYSEDLQHGQRFGEMKVRNPFL